MTSVQDHYDQHLGSVYSWMAGGIESAIERGAAELKALGSTPLGNGMVIDLGAGFGMHAIPLARRGFSVLAIDSCATLLGELSAQQGTLPIQIINDDIQSFQQHLSIKPELVLCMGDTITHLEDRASVAELIATVSAELSVGHRFVVSFRDYSTPLKEEQRFIPVRSDANRIFTCFLEYTDSHITVHDILHERNDSKWELRVSAYRKLRLSPEWLMTSLQENGFEVDRQKDLAGMVRLVAQRL